LSSPAKLTSFLVLLVLALGGAYYAGARLGPVAVTHSQVQGTGDGGDAGTGGAGMGGMDMGQP
jgi:hypothetical protein